MKQELITVCITTFQRKTLVGLAVQSVLDQSYSNFELILVDDYSNDGTKEFIENEILPLDPRIRFIFHDENKGLSCARNSAIFNARGKYFTFLDDDDEWQQDFLAKFYELAERYPHIPAFTCGTIHGSRKVYSPINGTIKSVIRQGYAPPVAAQFYLVKTLRAVQGYNPEIKSGVDHDLWLRLSFLDLEIRSLDLCLSKPNANVSLDRMTTNVNKRLTGIQNSLNIWKPDIEEHYDSEFYNDFSKAYISNVYSCFFINNIKQKDFSEAYKTFVKIDKKVSFLSRHIRRLLSKNSKEYSASALDL
ncbi:MAG: glycosyltransferase family 2 protein [Candidatus Cloacimonetes bacterium]|nr:glycosyltransferase family 2 protein [Candidatus Cloacimonadota bacterium]